MKQADKTNKFATQAEQNLPGQAMEKHQAGPTAGLHSATVSTEPSNLVSSAGATGLNAPAETAAAAPVPAPAEGLRLLALERTHELVAIHAVRLQQSGADSMHVVIQPGEGIRLSLELRRHDGGIEAQATLHRGDLQQLSRDWAELQQRLEPRGIRLSDLASANSSTGGQSQFQQSQRQFTQDESAGSAFADFAYGGSMTETPINRRASGKAKQGWETWA